MTAVFNAPENGDRSVANEAKTSDAPKFDLQALYSDMSATTRGGLSPQRDIGNQIDFGTNDNIYARSSDSQSSSNDGFNPEQQSAMDVARRFASFDDNDNNDHTNNINIDREDVGRLVEVYGDMYNMQDSLQDGNKAEAQNWLGEMRRDLASFTRGLLTDSDSEDGSRERHGQHENDERRHCPDESGSDGHGGEHEEQPGPHEDSGHEEEGSDGSEGSEGTSEDGAEHYQECESGEGHVDSGTEGYTPEDSMVLLQNDMQELTEALASGDTEAVQKIMARMNRHMAMLMRQLNGQESEEETGTPGGGGQYPIEDWFGTGPNLPGIPNPGDLFGNVPNPGDLIGSLPNPGDLLGGLPNPGDIFGSLPTPPNPQDIWRGVSPIPNPGDILRGLPQPPNPRDLLGSLPIPPNPGDLLRNLPSPGDLFDIF